MSKSSRNQIEQDEKKILFELVKNSNENIDTISKHCGFSRQKTWRFIKQLEAKKLIWGYTAVFDEAKIGFEHFILMIKRSTKPFAEKNVDIIVSRKLEDAAKELEIKLLKTVLMSMVSTTGLLLLFQRKLNKRKSLVT